MDFEIKHHDFEGPLEVLLELIEKEEFSISQLSLAKVADDFIRYMRSESIDDPEQLSEFLVIAAHLMLIKSRSLLPSLVLTEEEEGSVEDLEKRLAEYKRIRLLAGELKKMENRHAVIYSRDAYVGMEPVFYPPPEITPSVLADFFEKFLASLPQVQKLAEARVKKIVSIEEKIKQIQSLLHERIEKAFSEVVKGAKEKVEIIVSFLALLELCKQKFVSLEQENLFEDITIKRINHDA